ncbi:MAG: hypothetical protein ACE5D8_00715 [Fidelibacterota bacterium]
MVRGIIRLILTGSLLSLIWAGDDCSRCHSQPMPSFKSTGFNEKAVGVLDKGQLQNFTGNLGDLANFHLWFQNAGHWPRSAREDRQYAFGLGLLVGVAENNVIETVSQAQTRVIDWLPPDNIAGREYSGDITSASDETPFQASSDFYETWPFGYFDENGIWVDTEERIWPGFFRVDINAVDDSVLAQHPDSRLLPERVDEFTSDRDVYCTYNDNYNPRGSVGLEVAQTAYSYGRPYAEDFIFFEMKIHNAGPEDLDGIYVGLYAKLRPDYDNHDYIKTVDSDGDGRQDLIYIYDLNNTPNKTWGETSDPLGIPAVRIYDTPGNLGVTDFHHFSRGVSPINDEQYWAIMTSDPTSSDLPNPDYYFHGTNPRFDDVSDDFLSTYYPTWLDDESGVELPGDAINFIVSCGPFDLPQDSVVTFSLALIMGDGGTIPDQPDTTDLMANVRMANLMYRNYFLGSGPPDPPLVSAVPGDGRVTLHWSSEPAEISHDVLTGLRDFEGYKIFRSTDFGTSWGKIITDAHGVPVGFEPLATFDLSYEEDMIRFGQDISGLDPAFPQYLGINSGLSHTFVDSNLINGVEYWYCVTPYDKGNQKPDSLEQSYMYPIGSAPLEPHVVAVTPGVAVSNIIREADIPSGALSPIGGQCEGIVKVEVVDPAEITGHGYEITFTNQIISEGDTLDETGFTLVDTTEMDTLFVFHALSDNSGDNLPVVDGFRLTVQDAPHGVKSLGWTKVSGDMCTFDWRTQSIDPSMGPQLIQEDISTIDDWRITATYSGGDSVHWFDAFSGITQPQKQFVPLKIEIITDPDNPINVTQEAWLGEFAIAAPWEDYRKDFYSPLGWDLVPGGLGYLPGSPGWYEKHVDFFILDHVEFDSETGDTIPNYLYLFTNNKPDTSYNVLGEMEIIDAHAPSEGDEFTIITYKPFRKDISYRFGTTARMISSDRKGSLADVRVVPDPYIVTNIWEQTEFGKKLQFNHLPDQCTIKIYSLAGDHIATIDHDDTRGYAFWDMRTKNDQFIAPGVYFYHIQTPDKEETTGRFLVIK